MEEERIYTYKANFCLTNPVNDMETAYDYLADQNMTMRLFDSIVIGVLANTSLRSVSDKIREIIWILKTENRGSVYIKSYIELNEEQLSLIADFVYSQNTEGLGYDFSKQDFSFGEEGKSEFDPNHKIEFVSI